MCDKPPVSGDREFSFDVSRRHGVIPSPHHWEARWRELVTSPDRGPAATTARAGLAALAGVYGAVTSAYRSAFDWGLLRKVTAGCKVMSVGNLTVGGTGKSTTVRWLAGRLRDRGFNVAVVSYGYGAKSSEPVTVVSDGRQVLTPADVSGDEPRMLAEALPGVPVLIGKRRQLAAAWAIERFGAHVCILDDAFQYWRLVKDLDLVLIDATCPFGGGKLFPRGFLREAPQQIRRAHAVLLTNTHRLTQRESAALRQELRRLNPDATLAEARHAPRPLWPLTGPAAGCRRSACDSSHAGMEAAESRQPAAGSLSGCRVLALSSLGNPEGFEQMLTDLGAEVVPARYPDHHWYRSTEMGKEAQRARSMGCSMIVTTEKDAVKIEPGWVCELPVWVLPVELDFDTGQDELEALVDAVAAGEERGMRDGG